MGKADPYHEGPPPLLQERFEAQEDEHRLLNYRRGALWAAIFIALGAGMDWVAFGSESAEGLRSIVGTLFLLRMACSCGLLFVLFLLYRVSSGSRRTLHLLGHLVALIPMVTIQGMLSETGGGGSPYYAGLNLVMVGSVLLLRWRCVDGAISSTLCIVGYLAVALSTSTSIQDITIALFFLFVTAAFVCIGLYFYNRLRFAEFCLREEVVSQQEALAENHRKLQDLDEAKTRFFANISHELRTPLTLMLAPIEKLQSLNLVQNDAKVFELVNGLEDNGMRLLRLINDILDLVRMDSGEMPMRPERFRPRTFIDGLGRNLQPMADRKKIALRWEASCGENEEVYLDRDRLEKVVLNLAVNGLKFTPAGGEVSLSAAVEGRHLILEVEDNGAGMKEEQLDSVFERFWQADTSAAKKHNGAGIGLALVKSLTESMEGTVAIESEYGKGTKFTICVPLLSLPDEAEVTADGTEDPLTRVHNEARIRGALGMAENRRSSSEPFVAVGSSVDGSSSRELVLIAEDESGLRRFLKGEIEEMGCGVVEASDGTEGWELARQFEPQLIILDYMMPGMDGITLTQRLRQNDSTSQVPILLVTAAADETPRIHALEAGVSDFLTKPFTTAELRLRVRNLLDRQKYQRELGVINQELRVAVDERDVALEEIKENEARLLQAETLSSLGRMSAGIVHEVNNPMNYVKTALHALRMYADDVEEKEREDFEETVADAEEGVNRVIRIVSDLRSFTKGEAVMKEDISLSETVENARRLLAGELKGIAFRVDVPEDHRVGGNANQLCQVMVNLIQNSAQALEGTTGTGIEPRITVSSTLVGEDYVKVQVQDNGSGIAEEDLDHVFDPFFTKKEVGAGMGLGLSICHRILESHDGRIEVESDPGRSTVFSVFIPQPWQGLPDGEDLAGTVRGAPPEGPLDEAEADTADLQQAWEK